MWRPPAPESGRIGPPPSYARAADIGINEMAQYGVKNRKRMFDDEDGLEEDDEEDIAYQPAPGSPGAEGDKNVPDDDEDDPLDAFMAGIEVQAKKDQETAGTSEQATENKKKLGRTDLEEEDMQESYFKWMEEHKPEGEDDEDDEIEYDSEGNAFKRKKEIDPLPPIDHSTVNYADFEKNFYVEHAEIQGLSAKNVEELRKKLGIKVSGPVPAKPVCSFAHFGFDESLMSIIRKSEYTQPTPIQSQGIPLALSGRDMIGVAKTGSGKTAAYLWPAMVHIMDQKEVVAGEGPIVLICVPTRELALQVYSEAKRFGKVYNIRTVCAYGGGSKYEQSKALQEGAEMVVATPGRVIDLVKMGATNFTRVTFLVFDEADRMFDLGFESQVKSIATHVRPDRQCLMFSATFKKKVERLARDALTDPVRVVQGELGEANADVEQEVHVLPDPQFKWNWITQRLVDFCTVGKVLIFVTRKQNAEELATNLKAKDFDLVLLHGDMLQHDRNEVIQKFRHQDTPILVATDVAARGLDIPAIRTVINYDPARDADTHVHRIGRTGRAGEKGRAFTLVTEKDKEIAGHLVRNLESVNQPVPTALLELAMLSSWFRKSRFKHGFSKKVGGAGLGFKEKPALGGAGSSSYSTSSYLKPMTIKPPSLPNKGGSRLEAMKAAFSSSFKSSFHGASEETSWKSNIKPPEGKRKRSRWD